MDDTPYINDGADASLRKAVSLLNKIEAKTGSGSGPASGTVALDAASLNALENISVTFPATQNVNVTNAGLNVSVTNLPATQPVSGSISVSNFPGTQPVSGTFWPTTQPVSGSVSVSNLPATQPVSIANPPVTPVTDNGGSLTVDGSLTATQATAASLKAQAQLLNAAGSVVDYAMTGTAGTPATDVVTVQGISGGTVIPVSISNLPGTQAVSGTFWPATQPVSGSVSVSNFPATQPVSMSNPPVTPVTDNNGSLTVDGTVTSRLADGAGNSLTSVARGSERALSVQIVDASGAQVTTFGGGGGGGGSSGVGTTGEATVTSFSSLSSGTLKAANANRKMLTIFNEGIGTLFILYGNGTASTTNYSLRLLGGDYLEVDKYTGDVVGIFGGNGIAKITEIT